MRYFALKVASLALFTVFLEPGSFVAFFIEKPSNEEKIVVIDPPEANFFSKKLDCGGIPIKAHRDVADEALFEAKKRLGKMLENLPEVRKKLHEAGTELHIIGRNQVTSDLPEFRGMKGKPFDGKQTVDERTRGLGGILTSCGEENLLRLPDDRYRGRDICVHEFAHDIFDNGIDDSIREQFYDQHEKSLAKALWIGSYAGGNRDEYFSEMSMWYFGTHGDLHMKGDKPKDGRDGLKQYDPDGFSLIEKFYEGKLQSMKNPPPEKAEGNSIPSGKK